MEALANITHRCELLGSLALPLAAVSRLLEPVNSSEEQQESVLGHFLVVSAPRPGAKGGWLELAQPQAGLG